MIAAALIAFREGLEAALIAGIVLGYLRKMGYRGQAAVWWGVASAVVVSIIVGGLLQPLGISLRGRSEELFEGIMMVLAAGVLTWVILWMQRHGRYIRTQVETRTHQAMTGGGQRALFTLAFIAVVREGIETVLFLTAAALSTSPVEVLIGGGVGLAFAVGMGWLLFAVGLRLDVQFFFRLTSVLLILFAAGLVGRGVHEFQEAGVLPALVETVWNLNPVLDENSLVGSILKALFGYNGDPSLMEVIGYLFYWLLIGGVIGLQRRIAEGSLMSQGPVQ